MFREQKSSAKCAAVNVQVCRELTSRHNIRGVPTLILYLNGTPHPEPCPARQSQAIVKWTFNKCVPKVKLISSVSVAKQFISNNSVVILGFFKNAKGKANIFNSVAEHTAFEDCSFASTSEERVFNEYSAIDGDIYLFRKNQKLEKYELDMNADELVKLLYTKICPLTVLDSVSLQKIFSTPFDYHLLLFVSGFTGTSKTLIDTATAEGECHRKSVLFSVMDVNNPGAKRIVDYFGINSTCDGEIPTMRIISKCQQKKYKPDNNEISRKAIASFIRSVVQNLRKNYLKSAKRLADWNRRPVWCLTSDVHDEVTLQKGKLAFVMYYAPWCGPCKASAPAFEATAKKYENRTDVRLCNMDATCNEIPNQPRGYPTFRLYNKDNKCIDFNGARTVEGFSKFIDSN